MNASPWLTAQEAADYAREDISVIYEAAKTGDLVGHQRVAGGKWRFNVAAVDAWVQGVAYHPALAPVITRRRTG